MKICQGCGCQTNSTCYQNSKLVCPNCYDLLINQKVPFSELKNPNPSPVKYPTLQAISKAYRVLAVLTAIAAFILALHSVNSHNLLFAIIYLIGGIAGVIINLTIAEGILLFLGIEKNTREISPNIEKLLKSNQ